MSSVATFFTALIMAASAITGAMSPQDCPPNAVWQWYPEHGIWACGGER